MGDEHEFAPGWLEQTTMRAKASRTMEQAAEKGLNKVLAPYEDRIASLEAGNARLREALEAHHNWHLSVDEPDSYAVPDGRGGWIGLNRAEEYADSALYEQTLTALAGKEDNDGRDEPA